MNVPGIEFNIFSYRPVHERVYVLTEGFSYLHRFTMGLVIGDDKIAMIDTGMGMTQDLRKYVEFILGDEHKGKPIIALISHGALDHAGSAMLFDETYMNHRDWSRRTSVYGNIIKRMNDLPSFSIGNPEIIEYCRSHFLDNREYEDWKDIDDGQIFDLGGIKIQAIATPGHSAGHMAFFIPDAKVCFACDSINTHGSISPHIHFNNPEVRKEIEDIIGVPADAPQLTMQQCYGLYGEKVVKRVISIVGEDCTLYSGHMNLPMPIDIAKYYAQACIEIGQGYDLDCDPPGESIFPYSMNDVKGIKRRMHIIGNVCMEYDANLLDRNQKKD